MGQEMVLVGEHWKLDEKWNQWNNNESRMEGRISWRVTEAGWEMGFVGD